MTILQIILNQYTNRFKASLMLLQFVRMALAMPESLTEDTKELQTGVERLLP